MRDAQMLKAILLALALAACSTGTGAVDPPEQLDPQADGKEDSAGAGWTSVGLGVEYQRVNTGNAILIAYGGYTAHMSYSAAWSTELVDAKLGANDVGQIYAVKGPADPSYSAREIGNSKLRHHLATIDDGVSPIYVVAHSSGAYVADELFRQLYSAGSMNVLSRLSYACLDGGVDSLDSAIVDELARIQFVFAHDPTLSDGYSENHSAEVDLAQTYAPKSTDFEVSVSHTGCDDGAGWCLHDVLITHRPHNPDHFDLADDYTDFASRPVTIEYFAPWLPM